jgi:hypothetical protein
MSSISLSYYGIAQEEKIVSGEIRKLELNVVEPYTSNLLQYPINIYYQLFIQEGQEKIIVIDWTKVNRTYNGYFINLDTSWLIPNMFYIDIKYEYNSEVKKINDLIKFKVVSSLML